MRSERDGPRAGRWPARRRGFDRAGRPAGTEVDPVRLPHAPPGREGGGVHMEPTVRAAPERLTTPRVPGNANPGTPGRSALLVSRDRGFVELDADAGAI